MMMMMEDPTVLEEVSDELECLRLNDSIISSKKITNEDGMKFPPKCRELVFNSIPGNNKCVDCGTIHDVTWASVTYGVLLCTRCSGRHRSYGVATSRVRSITMDRWSHSQVLAMLEGGNDQLQNFYVRHDMGPPPKDDDIENNNNNNNKIFEKRYHTKAAKFYRRNMELHVNNIKQIGHWKGRAASRQQQQQRQRRHHRRGHKNNNKPSSKYGNKTATATAAATAMATTTHDMKPRVMVNSAA